MRGRLFAVVEGASNEWIFGRKRCDNTCLEYQCAPPQCTLRGDRVEKLTKVEENRRTNGPSEADVVRKVQVRPKIEWLRSCGMGSCDRQPRGNELADELVRFPVLCRCDDYMTGVSRPPS